MNGSPGKADQASLPLFRLSVLIQLLAAGFFGLFPWLAPAPFAELFGYSGDAPLAYRLFGASTTGYALAAAFALWRRPGWGELRIPLVATLTFTVSASWRLPSRSSLLAGRSYFRSSCSWPPGHFPPWRPIG